MIKIFIDALSIKRNPDAGVTRVRMFGPQEITFQCSNGTKFPKQFMDKVGITNWMSDRNEPDSDGKSEFCSHQSGYITDPDDAKEIMNYCIENKIEIEIKWDRGIQKLDCLPQPAYLYEHINTPVLCASKKCNHWQMSNEMEEIQDTYGEEMYPMAKCPECKKINTFHYAFETINEAIKRLKLKI